MDYIERTISSRILKSSKAFQVIAVTGPRQSGKSTLLRHLFDDVAYHSLEDPDVRLYATTDPRGFLNESRRMIIDEAQRVPELFSYIQGIVDADPERRFYLSGSSNFHLLKGISQSLAGRAAIFELLPLSLQELGGTEAGKGATADRLLADGLYPKVWAYGDLIDPADYYANYISTYLEKDVREIVNVSNLSKFHIFLKLCAARTGSIFNTSELANEADVSVNTIKSWLSVLEASYVIFLLRPYHSNIRKRLVKSPKLYFNDTGLAASLLGIETPEQMRTDRMRGHLFENMVISEAVKFGHNTGRIREWEYFRDSNGNELDLVIPLRNRFIGMEIKSAQTFRPDFEKGFIPFSKSVDPEEIAKAVVYAGTQERNGSDIRLVNYWHLDRFLTSSTD